MNDAVCVKSVLFMCCALKGNGKQEPAQWQVFILHVRLLSLLDSIIEVLLSLLRHTQAETGIFLSLFQTGLHAWMRAKLLGGLFYIGIKIFMQFV